MAASEVVGDALTRLLYCRTYTAAEGNKTTASCGRYEGSSSSGL